MIYLFGVFADMPLELGLKVMSNGNLIQTEKKEVFFPNACSSILIFLNLELRSNRNFY